MLTKSFLKYFNVFFVTFQCYETYTSIWGKSYSTDSKGE